MRSDIMKPSSDQDQSWVWGQPECPSQVILSHDKLAAYFHTDPVTDSTGTAAVRGTMGYVEGEHYWEIKFLEPLHGSSVMVGVATKDAKLHTTDYSYVNLIGMDEHGWGLSYRGQLWHGGRSQHYCPAFYDENTTIGVHLNLYTGTLAFSIDGHNLGVAFTGLDKVGKPLYPVISSTSVNTEMELTKSVSRYLTLQEKCFFSIAKHLRHQQDAKQLPLPVCFKEHLLAIR